MGDCLGLLIGAAVAQPPLGCSNEAGKAAKACVAAEIVVSSRAEAKNPQKRIHRIIFDKLR